MAFSNSLFWVTIISTILVDMILYGQIYNLWKTPQFPSRNTSDRIAVEINDRFLIDVQKKNSAYNYSVFNGQIYENLVNNYPWTQGTIDDISFSEDSFFEAIRTSGQQIRSSPFRKKLAFNISQISSILSLNQEVKLLSLKNQSTGCQYLMTLKEFQDQSQEIIFYQNATNCQSSQATLADLGNGIIAHQKNLNTIDIWDKKNFTKKVDSIKTSENSDSRFYINDFKNFSNPSTNQSIFAVRTGSSKDNHTIFQYNSRDKKYYKKAQFYYNGECYYHNHSICVSVKDDYLIVNENIDKQLISQKISDPSLSYMKDNILFETTHSSKYTIGYSKTQNKLNILSMSSGSITLNTFITNQSCVVDAKFTQDDLDLIVHHSNCDHNPSSNLCRVSPSNKSSDHCVRPIGDISDTHIDGFIELIEHPQTALLNRICFVMSKQKNNFYTIECRSSGDLKPLDKPEQKNYTFENKQYLSIIKTKILHTKQMKQNFWVVIQGTDSQDNIKNFTHKYKLLYNAVQDRYEITRFLQEKQIKVSFDLSGVHGQNLITLRQKNGSESQCALFYFDLQGLQIGNNLNYPCLNFIESYRLLLSEGYDQACLQLTYSDRIDCYKRYNNQKIVKKSIPVPQFNNNFSYFKPIINTADNWILFYETNSDNPSYVIMNISIIPIFRAYLSGLSQITGSYKNKFAYRPLFSQEEQNTKDEILAYAVGNNLYKLRNPVKELKRIQLEQRPENYKFKYETSILNYPNPKDLDSNSKTFLVSTGYHLIIIMYSKSSNSTMRFYVQLEQKNSSQPLWIDSDDNRIDHLDLSWNTFIIAASKDKVFFKNLEFQKNVNNHVSNHSGDKYGKIYVTNDDRLLYSVERSITNQSILYFMPSILKKQTYQINLNQTNNISQLLISANEDNFLVRNESFIVFVQFNKTTMNTNSYFIPIPNGFAGMYLTVKKQTNNGFKKSRNLQLEQLNEGQMGTKIIVTENYTLFCPTLSQKLLECSNRTSINQNTLLAISQQGNLIMYKWVDGDKKEWVHVMRIKTFSSIDSIQNISLKTLNGFNNLTYTPNAVSGFISPSETLYVLTLSIDDPYSFDPVFYVYTPNSCGIDKQSKNGQCICKPYYWTNYAHKNGSKVPEFAKCQCKHYFNTTTKQCQCPTWNGYINTTTQCKCPDGWYEQENNDKVKVCMIPQPQPDPQPIYWWVYLIVGTIIGVVVWIAIKFCKPCREWRKKKRQERKRQRLLEQQQQMDQNRRRMFSVQNQIN